MSNNLNYNDVLKQLDKTLPNDFEGEVPTNLLCLNVSKSYIDADLKVMVFGQETNDWYGSYSGADQSEWLKSIYTQST